MTTVAHRLAPHREFRRLDEVIDPHLNQLALENRLGAQNVHRESLEFSVAAEGNGLC